MTDMAHGNFPRVALLVPVFNPSAGWERLLWEKFHAFEQVVDQPVHLVVVDDGSSQSLEESAAYLSGQAAGRFTFLRHPANRGKGAALKTGAAHVSAERYMFTDVDFPYTLDSMMRVWQTLLREKGVVTGYRESTYYDGVSSFRTWLSKSLRALNTFLLRLPVNDTQCGLKGFDREVRDVLLICRTDRFLIDLELLLAVTAKHLPIVPVPVHLRDDVDFTRFRSSVLLREVFSFLGLIWKYRISSR